MEKGAQVADTNEIPQKSGIGVAMPAGVCIIGEGEGRRGESGG